MGGSVVSVSQQLWMNIAMNVGVRVSFWVTVFVFSWCMLRDGIMGSYNNCIFSFLGNLHTVIHSGCTFYIPTNRIGGLPFLHTLFSISLFVDVLMMFILTGMR